MLLLLLNALKTSYELKQLPGVGPTRVWRSANISAEGAITATALSTALCILQGWDWETQACLSLRSDSD